MSRSNIR